MVNRPDFKREDVEAYMKRGEKFKEISPEMQALANEMLDYYYATSDRLASSADIEGTTEETTQHNMFLHDLKRGLMYNFSKKKALENSVDLVENREKYFSGLESIIGSIDEFEQKAFSKDISQLKDYHKKTVLSGYDVAKKVQELQLKREEKDADVAAINKEIAQVAYMQQEFMAQHGIKENEFLALPGLKKGRSEYISDVFGSEADRFNKPSYQEEEYYNKVKSHIALDTFKNSGKTLDDVDALISSIGAKQDPQVITDEKDKASQELTDLQVKIDPLKTAKDFMQQYPDDKAQMSAYLNNIEADTGVRLPESAQANDEDARKEYVSALNEKIEELEKTKAQTNARLSSLKVAENALNNAPSYENPMYKKKFAEEFTEKGKRLAQGYLDNPLTPPEVDLTEIRNELDKAAVAFLITEERTDIDKKEQKETLAYLNELFNALELYKEARIQQERDKIKHQAKTENDLVGGAMEALFGDEAVFESTIQPDLAGTVSTEVADKLSTQWKQSTPNIEGLDLILGKIKANPAQKKAYLKKIKEKQKQYSDELKSFEREKGNSAQ